MNRTDKKKAPRNKKLSLKDEYRGTLELKNDAVDYDFVGQMPKKLQRKFEKELTRSKRKFKKKNCNINR